MTSPRNTTAMEGSRIKLMCLSQGFPLNVSQRFWLICITCYCVCISCITCYCVCISCITCYCVCISYVMWYYVFIFCVMWYYVCISCVMILCLGQCLTYCIIEFYTLTIECYVCMNWVSIFLDLLRHMNIYDNFVSKSYVCRIPLEAFNFISIRLFFLK